MRTGGWLILGLLLLAASWRTGAQTDLDVDVNQKVDVGPNSTANVVTEFNITVVNRTPPIDTKALVNDLIDSITGIWNRESCVKGLLNAMQKRTDLNIMVFNLGQDYDFDVADEDIQVYEDAKCGGVTFGIWAFCNGTFTNLGDGGYINWAFLGTWERDGSRVEFFDRCQNQTAD